MKSHEYAKRLHEIADFLLSRPEFEASHRPYMYHYTTSKAQVLAAARSFGSVKKDFQNDEIRITPADFPEFVIEAPRNIVCRIVKPAQPAEYDCEPLLSQAEEAELA